MNLDWITCCELGLLISNLHQLQHVKNSNDPQNLQIHFYDLRLHLKSRLHCNRYVALHFNLIL